MVRKKQVLCFLLIIISAGCSPKKVVGRSIMVPIGAAKGTVGGAAAGAAAGLVVPIFTSAVEGMGFIVQPEEKTGAGLVFLSTPLIAAAGAAGGAVEGAKRGWLMFKEDQAEKELIGDGITPEY